MRHQVQKATLSREIGPRQALMKSLAESLIIHESIVTTLPKARALRIFVEPLITRAKKGNLLSRRMLKQALFTEDVVKKMMDVIGPRYAERAGGYTRIIKTGTRPQDGADTARIELV